MIYKQLFAALATVLPAIAAAQISKPTDSELNAAPVQFQNLVHGRSDKINQSIKPQGGGPPGAGQVAGIPNPSRDPHDLRGYWVATGGTGGIPPGAGYAPGGGDGSQAVDPRVGDVAHTDIDADRMCLVSLGVNPAKTMKVYQTPSQLTLVYDNELRARRLYFTDRHTPQAAVSYNGDSIARWDGDTLVVDTTAIKGVITLMNADLEKGVHTLLLSRPTQHVVERITRSVDGRTLTDVATWNDPSDPTKSPDRRTMHYVFAADENSYDFVCEDVGDHFGPGYGGGAK